MKWYTPTTFLVLNLIYFFVAANFHFQPNCWAQLPPISSIMKADNNNWCVRQSFKNDTHPVWPDSWTQYLAIYNNKHLPKRIKIWQNGFKILPALVTLCVWEGVWVGVWVCSHLTKPLHKDGSFANKHLSRRTNTTQLIVELLSSPQWQIPNYNLGPTDQ